MLLTFADIKSELGIDLTSTDEDQAIGRHLRVISSRIRQQTGRKLHWVVDRLQVANDGLTVTCRCLSHGISSGVTVEVTNSSTTSSVDGEYSITRLNQDSLQFTLETEIDSGDIVDWNDAGLTASAVIHPAATVECKPTTIKDIWVPQRALPWYEPTELAYWSGSAWVAMDADTWTTQFEDEPAKAGRIVATSSFDIPMEVIRGRVGLTARTTDRNYRISYSAGADECPGDIQMAAMSLVCDLIELEGGGKDRQSESHEGSSVTRMSGDERREHILSPWNIIENWIAR